jgi:exopolyphosphatase/guanosine-5'-triphosphate,3'-diphosphate pyrophosphatase
MRAAVVDIGTNSTRLLIADVDQRRRLEQLVRRSEVTRLGDRVDATGTLAKDAMERTCAVLAQYSQAINEHGCDANLAVLTSAVRDAANGESFLARVRESYPLDARILSGDQEAQLTFLGAMSTRSERAHQTTVVIDIGGGSTEFVVGTGTEVQFNVSLQVGVVRMSERHIHSDPPTPSQLEALAQQARDTFADGVAVAQRTAVGTGVAVAGTATSAAAIAQSLDPYDPARVDKYQLSLATVDLLLARLAEMTEDQRKRVVGLHPDRTPTIVAGMVLLGEAMRAFDLDTVEVSEHDILVGGALSLAGPSPSAPRGQA